jgi:HTH-type transcriptional repressor of NAD biosynthesis genes
LALDQGTSFLFGGVLKRGLVIGKFLPLHEGHIALIRFAASRCDDLIVSMSFTAHDPIDPSLRFSWIKETFSRDAAIKTESVLDDFDDESRPWFERTKIWANFIRNRYPRVDLVFSSEEYGEHFAAHLGVAHLSFDPQRIQFPVSATKIRNNPFAFWDYIPVIVRPYFVKKICFYGPESTGKTVMAEKMAELFQTELVPEVARELITSNDFTIVDVLKIGRAQKERTMQKTKTANKILICDTDVITTEIYSQWYLKVVPNELYQLERAVQYDLYFLFDIDVPWIADGMRDLATEREQMFGIFRYELERRSLPYKLIRGNWEARTHMVIDQINAIIRPQG